MNWKYISQLFGHGQFISDIFGIITTLYGFVALMIRSFVHTRYTNKHRLPVFQNDSKLLTKFVLF